MLHDDDGDDVDPKETRARGFTAPGYDDVRSAFEMGHATDPGGAQLAIYRHGIPVVDVWIGRDAVGDRPFEEDTLSMVYSCSKGVVATCVAVLIERGQLDPDALVVDYWPEYGAAGKGATTVAQLLAHAGGLPHFPAHTVVDELGDWDRVAASFASAAPLWEPGSCVSYHAFSYGYLAGELIRRVSGRSVGAFVSSEIAGPLGLDLWIGLPEEHESRFARSTFTPGSPTDQVYADYVRQGVDLDHPLVQAMLADPVLREVDAVLDTRFGRSIEFPAANGIATARALARMYAACIGEVDGVRLIDDTTRARVTRPRTLGLQSALPIPESPDAVPAPPSDDESGFGLGYLVGSANPALGVGSFGHMGAGGRNAFAHPASGIAFGYTCSTMPDLPGPDPRWAWIDALRDIAQGRSA